MAERKPVDESRERFEKWFDNRPGNRREVTLETWQACERETRKQCAQIAHEVAKEIGGPSAATHMLNTGLNEFIRRLEAIRKGR